MCQRKKAKQKHRNSASVGVDSRTVVGSRDWKDANSGLARIVWYAFDYRVPRVVLVRNNARQQCLCLALSARKCSVIIQIGGIQAVPVQDHRKNRMKQSARRKVETEKLGHRGRTGKESDPIGHVSRPFVRTLARSRQRPVSGGSIAVHTRTSSRDVRKG